MIWRHWLIVSLFILPTVLLADTSTFLINVVGGEDTTPPTEPAIMTVDPIAATQIDVEWTTATDDVYLAGYVLLRDAVPIATTTLTSYIDTGLTASTTYAYSVYAFDSFGNVSTTSAPMATTTLALPVVPQATSTPSEIVESTQVLSLRNFSLTTDEHAAWLTWQTSRPARFELRWGRTESFELGYVISDVYRYNQETTITELEPGTTYMYELIGYDARGFQLDIRSGSFKTKALAAGVPPNVQNLRATLLSNGVVELNYLMPEGYNNQPVRIVRSYLGYPRDPFDGAVIFAGVAERFIDTKAFLQGETEYYSVFVVGTDGTYSSGAVARVSRTVQPNPTTITPDGVEVPIEVEELSLPDFDFDRAAIILIQDEEKMTFASNTVKLWLDKNTIIRIPYGAVPDTLKSIVVTVTDPADAKRSYSFLLRINKDRTAYEAVIAPLGVAGNSRIVVEIFDFERNVVGRYQKAVEWVQSDTVPSVFFPDQLVSAFKPGQTALFGALALFVVVLWFWWRRRVEDKQ